MARKDPKFTQKLRARIEKWDKYWRINREEYYEWTSFIMGDQWREDESRLFERYNKIPLTFNKLGAFKNHMQGDQMQNTPNLQIVPSENVPEKTAEVRAALVKNISLSSDAKSIYQVCFGQAIVGGFSAYRVGTDYENDYSFNQDLILEGFNDPTRCYWDLAAKDKCKIDGMYSGYRERMSRKMFRSIYGVKIERNIGSTAITEDTSLNFADDDSITVIDDYEREYDTVNIYKLSDSDGTVIDQKELNALEKIQVGEQEFIMFNGQPVSILDKRESPRYKVKHRKVAGDYILEESDFYTESLPLVFVDQDSYYDKKGNQITRSFFQDVKDAQRYLNYLATQSAYILKVSRYDQFIASRVNVRAPDTAAIWRDPSAQQGALVYDESPNGNKPEQLRPPELSASLMQQYDRCMMDLQTGTGLYNTQLGEMGNEVSGKAVDARTKRGSYNTYVPFNSLNIAIACGGKLINEAIPKIYDVERLMMLTMPDRENAPVSINKPSDDYGMQIENDMTKGRYKIRLMPGPSYEGQKTEALESMQMILQADPSLFKLIGDLYVENLPVPNNIELRNRIRTIVPPEIIEAGKTGQPIQQNNQQPNPEAILVQLKQQELQQKAQQAQQDTQVKMKELDLKQQELQRKALETHQDMSFQWEKIEAEKQEAAAKLQEQLVRYQAESQKTSADMQMNHANNLVKLLTHREKENRINH